MTAPLATAAQIAQVLGVPKSTVIRRAEREGWHFEEQPGRGGVRRLYSVDQLPADTRAALAWRQPAVVVPGVDPEQARAQVAAAGTVEGARLALQGGLAQRAAQARQQTSLRQAAELAPAAQARMDARLAVVRACETFTRASGLPAHQARIAFTLQYNSGALEVPASVRAEVATTSDTSIERWQAQLRKHGITALAGSYGNRAGSGRVDSQPALQDFIKAMLVTYPHARATQVMQGLQARFGAASSPVRAVLPSLRSLERWMEQWRTANAGTLLALANPDAWKNRQMVAFGSKSDGIDRLNQLWELDSSPADLMTDDGRVSLIGGIDVGTRWPRLVVSKTSKATAVAALVRRMLLDMGVPERVKTDNGSDYTSHHIARVFRALSPAGEDMQELCPPFQPWHKPHIERFFGTFTRDLVELCPGFIGHDVAERSAIEARQSFADRLMKRDEVVRVHMSAADLQAFCDQWIDSVYMHNPHEGLGGITPFEAAARGAAERRTIDDAHALDILLAEAPGNGGRRTVAKKGIRLDDTHFIAPELEAWVGREVQVRYDAMQHDLGRLYVFGGDDLQFICVAEAPERTGMNRHEVALKAKAIQTKRVQDERRALRAAAKRVGTDQVVDEILRSRAAQAGKLATLPARPAVAHTSPGLTAAADAAAATLAPRRSTADIEQLQALQAAQARIVATQVPTGTPNELAARRMAGGGVATPLFESLAQRVAWLLRQAGTRPLSTEEADCLATYRQAQPASYRRMADLVGQQLDQAGPQEDAPGRIAGGTGAV